ncbi:MAG: hypothetical protein NW223_23570 [Hyphomicrobiaceae bacterium]|nr:hypothetical protein [Hyphomicrobiaceae bacterium]
MKNMIKTTQVTHFMVEPTDYGWAVRIGSSRLGLFVSQKQAVADVRKRQKGLRAKGQKSDVTVVDEDAHAPRPRLQPFFRSR